MLEETLQEMKNFEAIHKETTDLFERTKKEIRETYKEPMATNKLNEVRKAYYASIQKAKDKGLKISNTEFEKLKNHIIDYITTPVPKEYFYTLETIKLIGKNITEPELEAYINKYGNNYIALKELINISNEYHIKTDYEFISFDDVLNRINDIQNQVIKYYNNYIPNTYETVIMIDENGIISQLKDYINTFIKNNK